MSLSIHSTSRLSAVVTVPVLLLAATLAGCESSSNNRAITSRRSGDTGAISPRDRRHVQSEVMNLADDYITSVEDVFGQLIRRTKAAPKLQFLFSARTDTALGALSNAVNPYPFAGMMDMVVLITLTRQSVQLPECRRILGEADAAEIEVILRAQELTAWNLATRFLTPTQVTELRELITAWRAENPNQIYVSHVRLVDFVGSTGGANAAGRPPTSIFRLLFIDPLAGMDPAVRELENSRDVAERMFFYIQRVQTIVFWEFEALAFRTLNSPRITEALAAFETFTANTSRFTDATSDFAKSITHFADNIPRERENAINQLAKVVASERQAILDATTKNLTAERIATIEQLNRAVTSERQAALEDVATRLTAERTAALEDISTRLNAERIATTQQVQALLESAKKDLQAATETSLRSSIDHLFYRLLLLALITIGAAFLAAAGYRLLFKNPKPS